MIDYIIYGVLIFFGLISLIFIFLIMTQKRRHETKNYKVKQARDYLFKKYIDNEDVIKPISTRFFFDALIDVDEQIHLEEGVRKRIISDFENTRFVKKQKKNLNSLSKHKRLIAIFYLGKLRTSVVYDLLFNRFSLEKDEAVKLAVISQMRYGLKLEYLSAIKESFIDSSDNYHQRLSTLLGNNYKRIYLILPTLSEDKRYDIVHGLVRIASFHSDSFLVSYMLKTLDWINLENPFSYDQNNLIKETILKNLLKFTPEILSTSKYLNHSDNKTKEYAIMSLAFRPTTQSIQHLIEGFDQSSLDEARVKTIAKMVLNDRTLLDHMLRLFSSLNTHQQLMLSVVFSERIDYVTFKIFTTNPNLLKRILKLILNQNIIEPIIDFLNNNRDEIIEKFFTNIIKEYLVSDEVMTNEFRIYLEGRVLESFSLTKLEQFSQKKEKTPVEKEKINWILRWIFFTLILFPVIFLIRVNVDILNMTFTEIISGFLIDVNIYLIFYFGAINSIYVVLFILALIGSKRQVNLDKTRKYTLLFTDKLLPGISIIAPAYNEEVSIIESVTSLLNIKYPNYEVVVVNDGSKDKTLEKLITHFKLERKHPTHQTSLNTKKVRGVYQAKDIPNLIVVDKQNGGKADALNVGINVSNKAFVCGIDADSILEGEALLKLASAMLDDTSPHIAMGGNIYPANGFKFDRGQVEKRGIPKESICRFQTIEYLRAFTSGRIGWSEIRSLMIISGAFGLFQKDVLIFGGGYLTSSGSFKKDTVGEDMELVVRLTRQALENKKNFRVSYVYNAYCYTELPSDLKTLMKQRNRWQRGLIDILSYHRKIALNPKFKRLAFFGYPYFFIFEFLGPFFEIQGYLVLIIALILGLLNTTIVLAIFTVSIAFGIVISLSSLFMTEREVLMMNRKETFILILYAILENFGYRQLLSVQRVFSTFSSLKESGSWGTQTRKGFKS